MKVFFLFSSLFILALACNQPRQKDAAIQETTPDQNMEAREGASLLELDNRLLKADSLVFVFYKDPHGTDSLRYTRYYTQYGTTDTALIRFFRDNLEDSTHRLDKVKDCRSEGKVWCFTKGDVFQTVYFSAYNKACSFLYIIKNGQFYYSDIGSGLTKKLAETRKLAREIK